MAGLRNLYFPEGAIRNWSNLDDVEIVIRYSMSTMNILALESVDEQARVARTLLPGTYALRRVQGATYTTKASAWVENALDVLNHPCEWALNTHARKLYLWSQTDKPEGLRAQGVAATDEYADPMFVDLKPGDFHLKPDSPALKMGIKQIDLKRRWTHKRFSEAATRVKRTAEARRAASGRRIRPAVWPVKAAI
jgi:hypothetical protein